MELNRVYSRKILWRLIYMYVFAKIYLGKDIYFRFAEKIETIVKGGLTNVDVESLKTIDFSPLIVLQKIAFSSGSLDDYMKFFDVNSEKFEELLSFVLSEVKKRKETDKVDTVYIYSCYRKLIEKFDVYVREFDKFLPKFKFYELESITQSVLCLMKVENEVIGTPKPILIKEAELLIKNFSSDRYVGLVYSVLVNVLA